MKDATFCFFFFHKEKTNNEPSVIFSFCCSFSSMNRKTEQSKIKMKKKHSDDEQIGLLGSTTSISVTAPSSLLAAYEFAVLLEERSFVVVLISFL